MVNVFWKRHVAIGKFAANKSNCSLRRAIWRHPPPILLMAPQVFCAVRNCRFPGSHLTCAHKCGTCQEYGHGQMECNSIQMRSALSQAAQHITLPSFMHCNAVNCSNRASHTVDAHHCETCGSRSTTCCVDSVVHNNQPYRAILVDVQCPTCKTSSDVHMDRPVFTDADCVICFDSGPCVMFEGCRHANICTNCASRL